MTGFAEEQVGSARVFWGNDGWVTPSKEKWVTHRVVPKGSLVIARDDGVKWPRWAIQIVSAFIVDVIDASEEEKPLPTAAGLLSMLYAEAGEGL